MKRLIYFCAILGFLSLAACAETPTTPELPVPPPLPEKSLITINWPTNLPAQALDYAGEVLGSLKITFNQFESARPKKPENEDSSWTWRYDDGPFIIWIHATVLAAEEVSWEIELEPTSIPKRVYSKGTTNSNGRSGAWDYYDVDNIIFEKLTWLRDAQEKFVVNATRYLKEYDITANADDSGSLIVKEREVKIYEATWDASGAGSWVSYDPSTGQQTDSGNWSA